MLNFTNLSGPLSGDICRTAEGALKPECLYRDFCPQISAYVIHAGITVCVAYVLGGWLLWAFWKWVNPCIDWGDIYQASPGLLKYLGDFRQEETKRYWDSFIRDRLSKLMLGYIIIVVWFSLPH
jgi:hypothetical protein